MDSPCDFELTLTVLGCGSSSGSPVIGCTCPTCTSTDPRNHRSRTSAWIEVNGVHFVIDTGPDFRYQALRERIPRLDAVLYTHPHADHLNGIDDLRAFCFKQKTALDIYGSPFTLNNICERFSYALLPPNQHWNRPVLNPHPLLGNSHTPDLIGGIPVYHAELPHGHWHSTAYRIGNIAWITDIKAISEEVLTDWQGLDYVFLDCLMDASYPSHLSVEEAFYYAARLQAKHTYLIHMTHQLDYHELSRRCPSTVFVAYDGLQVKSRYSLVHPA